MIFFVPAYLEFKSLPLARLAIPFLWGIISISESSEEETLDSELETDDSSSEEPFYITSKSESESDSEISSDSVSLSST